eukprot:TRINITY_DN7318_c0_g2_i2.p1 TRINITY_DN7318_c0_g2~~TRINITY_DN7318_c0_g2_i2.p1  ORF type:complete len:762 (-),score=141.37 TRINITY_DN7318_c0_g2_i2:8-2293(-)
MFGPSGDNSILLYAWGIYTNFKTTTQVYSHHTDMSLLRFTVPRAAFEPVSDRSTPPPLSEEQAVAVAREVRAVGLAKTQKKGRGVAWSNEDRLVIAKKAIDVGPTSAVQWWNSDPATSRRHLSKATCIRLRDEYTAELKKTAQKRAVLDCRDAGVSLPQAKRGRKAILTASEQESLAGLIATTRKTGGAVTLDFVSASARGLVKASDQPKRLVSDTCLGVEWARKHLLAQGWSLRRKTTGVAVNPMIEAEAKKKLQDEVCEAREKHHVPLSLIFNADHTALQLYPTRGMTYNVKGDRRVPIRDGDAKLAITAFLGANAEGKLLPLQLIYRGKTERSHASFSPKYAEYAREWHLTHNATHWATEQTSLDWIELVLKPAIAAIREANNLPENQRSILIFDAFCGQQTPAVREALEACHVIPVCIPAGHTSSLQPMDIVVNGPLKARLRNSFSTWYARVVEKLERHKNRTGGCVLYSKRTGGDFSASLYDSAWGTSHIVASLQQQSVADSVRLERGCTDWAQKDAHACGWYALTVLQLTLMGVIVDPQDHSPTVGDAMRLLQTVTAEDCEDLVNAPEQVSNLLSRLQQSPADDTSFAPDQRLTNFVAQAVLQSYHRVFGIRVRLTVLHSADGLLKSIPKGPVLVFDTQQQHFAAVFAKPYFPAEEELISELASVVKLTAKEARDRQLKWLCKAVSKITPASVVAGFVSAGLREAPADSSQTEEREETELVPPPGAPESSDLTEDGFDSLIAAFDSYLLSDTTLE